MSTAAFSIGIALLLLGGVLVGPAGSVLAIGGLAVASLALATAQRRGRVAVLGTVLGVVEAALAFAAVVWWSEGHHADWLVVLSVIGALVVGLLGYIALTIQRIAARS